MKILSCGFGRQSSGALVCSGLGLHRVPKFDAAIFADTMHELGSLYSYSRILQAWAIEHGIKVYRVSSGDLLDGILEGFEGKKRGRYYINFPAYYWNTKYQMVSCMRRQCTDRYKIEAVRKKMRELLGGSVRGKVVELSIGISIEEVHRVKPSPRKWIKHVYPLIDAKLSATQCQKIVRDAGLPNPARSACDFCPFHGDSHWAYLKFEEPTTWEKVCKIDETIRDRAECFGIKDIRGGLYLHKSFTPLRALKLSRTEEGMLSGFGNDCSGYCGI